MTRTRGFLTHAVRTALTARRSIQPALAIVAALVVAAPFATAAPDDLLVDDEYCETMADEHPDVVLSCRFGYAEEDAPDGLLILSGSFCDEPSVFAGVAGGSMQPLLLLSADASQIVAELPTGIGDATSVVLVECPCGACSVDVTLGHPGPVGSTGPQGPPGPTGSPGPTGPTGPTGPPSGDGGGGDGGGDGGSGSGGYPGNKIPVPQRCPDGDFVYGLDGLGIILCAEPDGGNGDGGGIATCPCYDTSDVEGVGIDFLARVLFNTHCIDLTPDGLQLRGSRGPDLGNLAHEPNAWIANAVFEPLTVSNQCYFIDNTHGVHNTWIEITDAEVEACMEILTQSEMFVLNNCPFPGDDPPVIGVDPASLSDTLLTGERRTHVVTLSNSGESSLVFSAQIEPGDSFASLSVSTGSVAPTETYELEVLFDATGLAGALYEAELEISSNDPVTPTVVVHLSLTVIGAPDILVVPTALDFEDVPVGTSEELLLVVQNQGEETLDINSITSDSPEFSAIPTSFGLGAGSSQEVHVTFSPSSVASFSGTLTIASNDPDSPLLTVTLAGNGAAAPAIAVSPASIAVELPPNAQTSEPLTLSNVGFGQLVFTVTDSGSFVDVQPAGGTVPEGNSQILDVTFDSTGLAAGLHAAEIHVASNDLSNPLVVVPVSLEILAEPRISVSPTALDFGAVSIGEDAGRTLNVFNNGTAALVVSMIASDTAEFAPSVTSVTVAAGTFEPVTVVFSPSVAGPISGTLSLTSDDLTQPVLAVPLAGLGIAPDISLPVDALDFAVVSVGAEATLPLRIDNLGAGTLVITSITSDALEFTVLPTSLSIPGSGSATVQVRFAPTSLDAISATLSIASNDPDEPGVTVSLAGTGVAAPAIDVTPTSLDSTLPNGGQETQLLTLSNSGGNLLEFSISAEWVSEPVSATSVFVVPEPTTGTVSPAGSTDVDITFTATGLPAGVHEANILIASNDPLTPLVSVAATLTVTAAPNIQLPGEMVVSESTEAYTSAGATTRHALPAAAPPVGGGTLELIAEGDYTSGDATTLTGGRTLGSVGPDPVACSQLVANYPIDEVLLSGLAADGVVGIEVANSPGVPADCPQNRHTVLLSYTEERQALDFGTVEVGTSTELSFVILNTGTETLQLTSISSDAAEFTVSPTAASIDRGRSEEVTVSFAPAGTGAFAATLTLASNDPDRPALSIQLSGEGGTSRIDVTPAQLDFGDVDIGQSGDLLLTIENTGALPLEVSSISGDLPEFAASATSLTVAPLSSESIVVTFTPSTTGPLAATLSIESNDPVSPLIEVPLSGSGIGEPDISIDPTALDFGTETVGSNAVLMLTVFNSGTADLEVGGISSDNPDFSPSVSSLTVAAGSFESMSVVFAPSTAGVIPGTLSLASDDPDQPLLEVAMEGVGIAPEISLPIDALEFGEIGVGGDHTLPLQIDNLDPGAPLVITSISSDALEFTVVPTGLTIPGGGTDTVDVTFTPTGVGPVSATLSIASNDLDEPVVTVSLGGTGTTPPLIDVTPTSMSSTLPAGGQETQLMTLSNNGGSPLEFSITAEWETDPLSPTAVFVNVDPAAGNVAIGGTLDVDVHFTATGLPEGDHVAQILVSSNDPLTPLVTVPATLTVVGAPHIQIPGEPVTLVSSVDRGPDGTTTLHALAGAGAPVGGAWLELTVNGDYASDEQLALAIAEGTFVGNVGNANTECATASQTFPVGAGFLDGLLANGTIDVVVEDTEPVEAICAVNNHTVTLTYEPRRTALAFGTIGTLGTMELPIEIRNNGTRALQVNSITTDSGEFSVLPTSAAVEAGRSATVWVTFAPPAAGAYGGVMTILSDDPDEPQLQLILSGTGGAQVLTLP